MAVWQFGLIVMPVAGIVRIHGQMIDVLPGDADNAFEISFDQAELVPNYWEGIDNTQLQMLANSLLPRAPSWSDAATMYGDEKTDHIQIWDDSVHVRLDCRNVNAALLAAVVAAARDAHCCIVLCEGGRILSPVLECVSDALQASAASRFVLNPRQFLASADRLAQRG
ncbi:hypothetical protein [Massilia sp. CCM 8734]|uniref:hypothetical protein n=1 Tax=Massilia sp. CCM 8734 TaxID=2609283 RepID=UPI0014224026|nr:hypothetical protein [Massilia sp. CCM 8734]NHZ97927.1 hypothetical protein [Massilia sp. CCM 8734]